MVNATAKTIRAEIQRRIREQATDHDCSNCTAPMPVRSEVNAHGSHWSVGTMVGTPFHCLDFILRIIGEVMAEYELIE